MNIGSILTEAAAKFGGLTGIRSGANETTYAQWNNRSTAFAESLADQGVQPGDRVGILQQNGPVLLESLFGVFKAGAVAVPINARLHHEEYGFILEHAGVKAVVFSPGFADGLASQRTRLANDTWWVSAGPSSGWSDSFEAAVQSHPGTSPDTPRAPDDLCWLFYTSGTTGRPKGAMVTHGNLAFMTEQYPLEVRDVRPGEVALHVAPLTHAGGLWSIPLVGSGAVHLIPDPPQFDPTGVLRLIEAEGVRQIVFVAPTMLTMLLDASEALDQAEEPMPDVSSLELIGYGGSPAYSSELTRAMTFFGPVLCQIYGQGECPMTISMLKPEQHCHPDPAVQERRLTSAGVVRDRIEVAVLDATDKKMATREAGEICVRGPVVMQGYWQDQGATEQALRSGWYHTGDLGRIDADGYVYLLDRIKDLIITGGSNVYGREVEDVLLRHAGVAEVAVIGVPDPKWGELVTAVVVAADPVPSTDELGQLCADHLAGFKKPRRWEFRDELPKNGYGKVLKRELRSEYSQL